MGVGADGGSGLDVMVVCGADLLLWARDWGSGGTQRGLGVVVIELGSTAAMVQVKT